jgi:hypothetical protein
LLNSRVEPKGIVLKTDSKTELNEEISAQEVVMRGSISSSPVPKKAKLQKSSKSFTKSAVKANKIKPNERRESDKYKSKKYLLSDSDDSSCDLTLIDKSCEDIKSVVNLEMDSNLTNTNAQKKPKPKPRKRLTREALDPVDEFSPIIILEKIKIPESDTNCTQING